MLHNMPTGPEKDALNAIADDPQLRLEMHAFAELLLEIYEYRLELEHKEKVEKSSAHLDARRTPHRMEERSKSEPIMN